MHRPRIITCRTRDVPAGEYSPTCPNCLRTFRTDDARTVYCSDRCEKAAANARSYQRRKQCHTTCVTPTSARSASQRSAFASSRRSFSVRSHSGSGTVTGGSGSLVSSVPPLSRL